MRLDADYIASVLCDYFSRRAEVKFVYLFGSMVSGRANRLSDVDIAICVDPEALEQDYPYGYRAEVITDLMKALRTNRIDVVVLNTAPPFFRFRVIRYGKLVFSRAESERVALQVRTLNEYNDLKPLWKVHDHYLSERIRQGRFGL